MDVIIFYNPNSTGPSEKNARAFADELRATAKKLTVTVRGTTHAGHLEEIAAKHAKSGKEIMLIASSGDGGYHELVNGALAHAGSKVITGVLPSGNANDHHTWQSKGDVCERIRDKAIDTMDVLKLESTVNGKPWLRYGHSYAGIGISAEVAKDLTKQRPNMLSEKWLLVRSLLSFRYIKIVPKRLGHARRYSSVLFANIPHMSKVLKVAPGSHSRDGKFEVSLISFRSKPLLIFALIKAATIGLQRSFSVKSYEFTTTKKTPLQIDGEQYELAANQAVKVSSARRVLRCIV